MMGSEPQQWVDDCYFGVVTTYLNAITAVEFEQGLEEAAAVFVVAKDMLLKEKEHLANANW